MYVAVHQVFETAYQGLAPSLELPNMCLGLPIRHLQLPNMGLGLPNI